MARLIFQGERFGGRCFMLAVEVTTVGRGAHNALVIDDPSVSADHCELLVYGTEVIVREHGSTNGTFVGGVRVEGQYPVKSGEVIRFGAIETRLELGPGDEFDEEAATGQSAAFLQQEWSHRRPDPQPPSPVATAAPPTTNPSPEPGGTGVLPLKASAEPLPEPVETDSAAPPGRRNVAGLPYAVVPVTVGLLILLIVWLLVWLLR